MLHLWWKRVFGLSSLFKCASMGFILDMTETLKTPAGLVGLVVLIGIIYVWYKWMFAPHPDDED
jgi:hypothetical protein